MLIGSNYGQQRKTKQHAQNKQKLLQNFNGSLRNQTEATGKMLQVANKQTAAMEVAGQQGSYYFKDWIRNTKLAWNQAAGPKPEQPPITGSQMRQAGMQGLKATPDVAVASAKLMASQRQWNKASALEDKVLKTEAQQALDTDRHAVRFQGEKYYDAFESPREMKTAFQGYQKPKLLTPEISDDPQIYYSKRFQDTMQQRYGENPFQPTKTVNFLGKDTTPPPPKPIAYQSSKGWIYDQKTMDYLENRNKPEDLSWIADMQKRTVGYQQLRDGAQPG